MLIPLLMLARRRNAGNLGFSDVLEATRRYVMQPAPNARTETLSKTIQARYIFALMDLGQSDTTPVVKAKTDAMLRKLQGDLEAPNSGHGKWLVSRIEAYLNQSCPLCRI